MAKDTERPIGIDLFSGAGGLSLGFEQAGFDIAAAVEIDPIHAAVHEFNFPRSTTICGSVSELSGAEIRRRARLEGCRIDVVFGGAPCQGFSMIGKRALDDPRNRLVQDYVRLVVELETPYFVFENVRGLTLGEHRRFLDELIAAFNAAGYDVVEPYAVLNAASFGVPQDRLRLFLMGARKGFGLPSYPAPSPPVNVREALSDLPDADAFPALMDGDSVRARFGKGSTYARRLRGIEADPLDYGYRRLFDPELLTSSARTTHTAKSRSRFASTRHGETEPVSRFHKLDPLGVCNTIRAGTDSARGAFTSPRPIHYERNRVITVREAARLHSFPDWFRFHVTKWHGFREVGNSVPPLLARAVAAEVRRAAGFRPSRPRTILELGDERLLRLTMAEASRHFGLAKIPIATRVRRNASAATSQAEFVYG
ncbi:MAG: DNA cytosine methyltransferase [Gammaproteobacteria bacterium]|nr:DNA cytosine methyltransferase [Gammaproteobacteria bacterium]